MPRTVPRNPSMGMAQTMMRTSPRESWALSPSRVDSSRMSSPAADPEPRSDRRMRTSRSRVTRRLLWADGGRDARCVSQFWATWAASVSFRHRSAGDGLSATGGANWSSCSSDWLDRWATTPKYFEIRMPIAAANRMVAAMATGWPAKYRCRGSTSGVAGVIRTPAISP